MKLVIKADEILATHTDEQEVTLSTYPGATEIKTVRDDLEVTKEVVSGEETKTTFKTVTELGLIPEDERTVRLIDGGKISQATLDELNGASTIAALRTVLSKILTGTP